MWKASISAKPVEIKMPINTVDDDDWETDPDFINDVTEEEQRWGSKTVEGSGRMAGAIDMQKLVQETKEAEAQRKQKQVEEMNSGFGYGGKFGIETDRMDRSAVGHDYIAKLEKHESQKDYATGFGGKFGVQTDRVDKSAAGWDYKEKLEKHASQKDYSAGFGGKFGVQADRQDKSAVGWDHVEKVDKHESQKDYSKGFGGKFGVQADRQDRSAVGWDHHESVSRHESQVDHKRGFGGKFGVQTDRMDKSALAFADESPTKVGTTYTPVKPDIGGAKLSDVRAKFENMSRSESATKIEPEKKSIKQLDSAKTAMFSNTKPVQTNVERKEPIKIDREPPKTEPIAKTEEAPPKEETKPIEVEATTVVPTESEPAEEPNVEEEEVAEIEDTGLIAVALYDYQSAADDEISFDPEDIITHLEMIDEGWWRGLCRGRYGLFPANYVQLQPR